MSGGRFQIKPGERVALTGPSGSGKTTLLRALAGLIDVDEGTITLDGVTPESLGWPAYRRRVLYVHQRPVLRDASIRTNLEEPFTYRSADGATFPEAQARSLLADVGLADRLEHGTRTLSVGEAQRVGLVRALLVSPQILLLDEPTSALDTETASRVETVLARTLDAYEAGLLIVSHDEAQVARLCTRRVSVAGEVE